MQPRPARSRWGQSDAYLLCQTLFLIDGWHTASNMRVCERPCFINRLQREFSSINVYEGNAGLNLFLLLVSAGTKRTQGAGGRSTIFIILNLSDQFFFFPFPMIMLKSKNSCSLLSVLSLKNKQSKPQTNSTQVLSQKLSLQFSPSFHLLSK